MYSYLGVRQQRTNGKVVTASTVGSLFIFTYAMSLLLFYSYKGVDKCFNICVAHTFEEWIIFLSQYSPAIVILLFVICYFETQFMCFLAREYLLVLRSTQAMAAKMRVLKSDKRRSAKIFDDVNIVETGETGTYQMLRRTYQKMEVKQWLGISAVSLFFVGALSLLSGLPFMLSPKNGNQGSEP